MKTGIVNADRRRWTPFLVVLLAIVSACQPIARNEPGKISARAQREREAEYSVYSFLLRRGKLPQPVIVGDSTAPPFQGRAVFCFQPDRKPGNCLEPRPGTSVEAWKDYASKNRQAWPVLPLFEKDMNVIMKRDTTLAEATCDGPTITYFSRVGFNPALTQAIVNVTTVTGKGQMPPCGFARGENLVLERTPTGWKPVGDQFIWVT